MFVHQIREARIASDAVEDFDERLDSLPDAFRRTLLPARQMIADVVKLASVAEAQPSGDPPPTRPINQDIVRAELIGTDTHVFAIYVRRIRRRRAIHDEASGERKVVVEDTHDIFVHSFGPDFDSKEIGSLCDFLNNTLSINLKSFSYTSERLDELMAEGRTPTTMPSAGEIAASRVLSDKTARILAIAVKQSSGLLVGDLGRQLPQEERSRTESIRSALVDAGIVAPEAVVICSKTGAQVAKIADPSILKDFADRGLKCACGNAITDEKIDTALSVSELGRLLLDSSHWLTVLLIQYLTDLGVPLDRILVDHISDGDEMDCIADISGEIVLFELKDKEFNLGNAYSFGAKIGIVGPEYPVIFTTEHVGNDAKGHFSKPRRGSSRTSYGEVDPDEQTVTYIEGIENLHSGLMTLISQINLNDARTALENVLPFGTVSTTSVLNSLSTRLIYGDPAMVNPVNRRSPRRRGSRSGTEMK